MEVGVQFFPNVGPDEVAAARYFAECLEIAEEAEALGFTHARIVEHYFHRYGGYTPNPLIFLSALSQRTKTMRLVTGAVLPVFNNPLKLAGEIGMVDALSNGRLDVGFARAFLPHEFGHFGVPLDESQARFREGIEQIGMLLSQDVATSNGQFHSFSNVTSLPRPTQSPRPKFLVAGTQTAETFEFAGRNGYSLMAIPMGNQAPLFELYRQSWRDAGHPGDGEIMIAFHMFCHEDAEQARAIAREPFDGYFKSMAEVTQAWVNGSTSKDYAGYGESMKKLNAATLESQIEAGGAWVGTPDEIVEIARGITNRLGKFEHASIQINFGALPLDKAQASMRLFAEKVMPRL